MAPAATTASVAPMSDTCLARFPAAAERKLVRQPAPTGPAGSAAGSWGDRIDGGREPAARTAGWREVVDFRRRKRRSGQKSAPGTGPATSAARSVEMSPMSSTSSIDRGGGSAKPSSVDNRSVPGSGTRSSAVGAVRWTCGSTRFRGLVICRSAPADSRVPRTADDYRHINLMLRTHYKKFFLTARRAALAQRAGGACNPTKVTNP